MTNHDNDNFVPRGPLLQARTETARLLACSIDTIRRLERRKLLTPIRLGEGDRSPVSHEVRQVDELVRRLASGEVSIDGEANGDDEAKR